jgi:hypothetical protein
VRLVKEESEAGMLPRSSLKWRKRPVIAESSATASGMNPVSDRPCKEMLATLPTDYSPTTTNPIALKSKTINQNIARTI